MNRHRANPLPAYSLLLAILATASCGSPSPLPLPQTSSPTRSRVQATSTTQVTTPTTTLPPPHPNVPLILSLLETNGECSLPCWWGIQPQASPTSQLLGLLDSLGSRVSLQSSGSEERYHAGFDIWERNQFIDVDARTAGDLVQDITVHASSLDPDRFWQDWLSYRPDRLVSESGAPTRAWLIIDGTETGPVYHLILLYDEEGYAVEYSGGVRQGIDYSICPLGLQGTDLFESITLYLQSPSSLTSIDSLVSVPSYIQPNLKPVEEASGLTMAGLASLLGGSAGEGCFTTPSAIWPP